MLRSVGFTLALLLSASSPVAACCGGEPHSLTELLLHDSYQRDIFKATVQRVFVGPKGGCQSVVTIDQVYKGSILQDSVIVRTGGNTTAGGGCLKKGQQWVFFSKGKNGVYGATVCDRFSFMLPDESGKSFNRLVDESWPGDVLRILGQYESLRAQRQWQKVEFRRQTGLLLAAGGWENGVPTDQWQHYVDRGEPDAVGYLKSEVCYRAGKLNGEQRIYENRGQLRVVHEYDEEERIVQSLYYNRRAPYQRQALYKMIFHPDGVAQYTERYDTSGAIAESYTERQIRSADHLPQGFRYCVGPYRTYYSNGQVKEEGAYERGLPLGPWTTYDPGGAVMDVRVYHRPPQLKPKEWQVYHPSGKLAVEGQFDEQDRPHGPWKYFDQEGQLQRAGHFEHGLRTGEWLRYHYRTGKRISRHLFVDGKAEGPYVAYFSDGQTVSAQGQYRQGQRSGDWVIYQAKGVLHQTVSYDSNGLRTGLLTYYHRSNGSKRLELRMVDDVEEGPARAYHDNGQLAEVGQYRGGRKAGPWKYYDQNGQLIRACEHDPNDMWGFGDCVQISENGERIPMKY